MDVDVDQDPAPLVASSPCYKSASPDIRRHHQCHVDRCILTASANPLDAHDFVELHVATLHETSGSVIIAHDMQGVASPPWVQGIFQELEAIKSLAYETKAMVRNVSRALHNKQEKLSNYVPLCKWLPGSGREIALGIFTAAEVNDAENLLTDAGHQNPVVGDIPRTPSSPSDVTRVELAALVIFYNHNMGLVVGENQLARKEKLHTFMTDSSTFK